MNVVLFFWWCRLSAGLVPHREDDLQLLGMAKTNSYHQLVTDKEMQTHKRKRRVFQHLPTQREHLNTSIWGGVASWTSLEFHHEGLGTTTHEMI